VNTRSMENFLEMGRDYEAEDERHPMDEDYLRPCALLCLHRRWHGIDRLTMLLADRHTIRRSFCPHLRERESRAQAT
jgi:lysyl-tRNA synthetase class II